MEISLTGVCNMRFKKNKTKSVTNSVLERKKSEKMVCWVFDIISMRKKSEKMVYWGFVIISVLI